MTFASLADQLAQIGREFHARGWVLGTSGNFSAVVSRNPLRLAITSSGVDKGSLSPAQVVEIDGRGKVLAGSGRQSANGRNRAGSRGSRSTPTPCAWPQATLAGLASTKTTSTPAARRA